MRQVFLYCVYTTKVLRRASARIRIVTVHQRRFDSVTWSPGNLFCVPRVVQKRIKERFLSVSIQLELQSYVFHCISAVRCGDDWDQEPRGTSLNGDARAESACVLPGAQQLDCLHPRTGTQNAIGPPDENSTCCSSKTTIPLQRSFTKCVLATNTHNECVRNNCILHAIINW